MNEMPALTQLYRRSQPLYLLTVACLTLAGYTLIFLVPVLATYLLLGLPWSIAAAQTGSDTLVLILKTLFIALLIWTSYDLFRLPFKPPGSNRLAPNQFPELWALIAQLEETFPRAVIERISLTPRFELELVRTPKYGIPIKHSNTLLLGLPLLQSVSKDQLRALIARKMALVPTFTAKLPKAWVYHARMLWVQYADVGFRRWSPASIWIQLTFSWFAPYFERASVHAARLAELDADGAALAAVDAWTMEEAFTTYTLRKFFIENKLWPAIMRMAEKYPKPPMLPYVSMETLIAKELDQDRAHRLFDRLMHSSTSYDGSIMPPLKQRWESMGSRPRVPLPVSVNAAKTLLGDKLSQFQQEMDKTWLRNNLASWKAHFHKSQKDQVRLQELIEQLPKDLLSNEEIWECTVLVKRYMGQPKAVEFYKAVLETLPREADIYFKIGSFLLECRDKAGVKALETAMALDRKYTTEVCELLSDFMQFTGERRKAKTYQRRAVEFNGSAA